MKKLSLITLLLLGACANNPQGGAAVGGAVGGGSGAAVGYEMGGREGAIIGGAIGGAAGAAVGSDASQPAQQGDQRPVMRKRRGHDEEKHREHRKGGRERHGDDD